MASLSEAIITFVWNKVPVSNYPLTSGRTGAVVGDA
jgi:hypothetical protein